MSDLIKRIIAESEQPRGAEEARITAELRWLLNEAAEQLERYEVLLNYAVKIREERDERIEELKRWQASAREVLPDSWLAEVDARADEEQQQ